jgi:hypothetical protein
VELADEEICLLDDENRRFIKPPFSSALDHLA